MLNIDFKFVKDWARKNLVNTKAYCPILNSYIKFTNTGVKHGIFYKKSEVKIAILLNILEIIQNAKSFVTEIEKDKKKRKLVKKVFKLKSTKEIEGTIYDVYIIVKELQDGLPKRLT